MVDPYQTHVHTLLALDVKHLLISQTSGRKKMPQLLIYFHALNKSPCCLRRHHAQQEVTLKGIKMAHAGLLFYIIHY